MKYEQLIEREIEKAKQQYKWGIVIYVEKIYRELQSQGYRISRKAIWHYIVKRLNSKGEFVVAKQLHTNARMKLYLIRKELFKEVEPYLPGKIKIVSQI
jgi:hypothetical protein